MGESQNKENKKISQRESELIGIDWFSDGAGTYDLVSEMKKPIHYRLVDAFDMFMENDED